MTETSPARPAAETPGRAVVAGVIALAGHAVTFLLGYVATLVVTPSPGGGFEDLAAVAVTFLGSQVVLGLACLITSTVLFRKGRQYTGLGLMGGWLVGVAVVFVLVLGN